MKVQNCRYPLILSSLVAALALAGCKGDVLDYRNVQFANGKVYAGDANQPFSGTLTNVPSRIILGLNRASAKSLRASSASCPHSRTTTFSRSASTTSQPICAFPFRSTAIRTLTTGFWTVKPSAKRRTQTMFGLKWHSRGRPDGQLTIYTPDGASQKLASIAFRGGEPDGRQEIYSPTTHRLIHASNWTKGTPEGQEEGFDENTGNRILIATYVNGQVNGPFTRYAADGKQVTYRAMFANGKPEGTEETYDPMTGKTYRSCGVHKWAVERHRQTLEY
ncbi:hypothetical protein KEH56_35145 [Burkholderia cenocepacia]|uniref:toxin-antitoxin system YwqK family antitoxin n=1 Tax=Burkholderia cenocepacia TaxID=95486 RepID=UPI001BA561ED|nr:hypothetical protein [Burkholderia cenocepacia]QUN44432.1 hypothetical protein KEH56_35145 [Burkholderia cenocepacia]